MAVTYRTALKTARLNEVITDIGTTGVLQIGTSAMGSVLVEFDLSNPAGSATGADLTFSFVSASENASATGTAAAARIRTATGGTDIITGLTVGTSGTDIVLNSTSITSGQQVTITAAVITHG